MIDPLTLTMAELAARWNMTVPQALSHALHHSLPMYFYFDGLVFNFGDKWHRANGDAHDAQDLEAQQTRLSSAEIDLQRQNLHKRGLLKLTQWEEELSHEALQNLGAETARLATEIARLTDLLKERNEERQRHVRNGLLRAAPRTLQDIAQQGRVRFPQFAYMPNSPARLADAPAPEGPVKDGAVIALEDGFPLKEWLSDADLVASMQDVRAVEADRG